MTGFLAVCFAAAGLAFGSFLTVVVHRLPRGASVVQPRSACPGCGVPVQARDNIPLVSYVLLRSRCRTCHSHISAEYPVVEAVTAGLFVASALVIASPWIAAIVAPFLGVLFAAGLIDARHRIIPNRLTYVSLGLFAAAILAAAIGGMAVSIEGAAIGCAAYAGGLLAIALIAPSGMGMGDVKFAAVIGVVLGALGLRYVAAAALLAVLAGGIGAVVALALGRGRKGTIPFGPYMAGAGAVAALFGSQLSSWYLGLAH
jgi:leader peptidase (prepilin peptidase)/N-methyltransferase